MREQEGAETLRRDEERIKQSLFVGIAEEDVLKRLAESQGPKSVTLFITTPGIGLSLCHLAYISRNYREQTVVPSIYAMYRVFLGILEAKFESLKQSYPLPARNVDHVYQYEVDATFLRLC